MQIFGKHIYTIQSHTICAFNYYELLECFKILQRHIDSKKRGYYVGYISYEAGILLQTYKKPPFERLYNEVLKNIESNKPLAYFTLFKRRRKIKGKLDSMAKDSILEVKKDIDSEKYSSDFLAIKDYISRGDTYQVNYTQEMLFAPAKSYSDFSIFKALCARQNAPYKAFLHTRFCNILCFSPELFFKIKNDVIKTQPMKGTIKRDINNKKNDKRLKKILKADSKNRSENVMIVDLLRNDLSRINGIDKVKVKELFTIHSYKTLHQMVSTITALLPKKYSLLDIFLSLFPCGSITGAPKLSTMEIIRELEKRNREIYCGAIGVINHKKILFNIPIRTMVKYHNESFYRYGVGSGVVWDSILDSEISELYLKSSFLRN